MLIESGCVKILRDNLKVNNFNENTKDIMIETIWLLTNVAAGDRNDVNYLIKLNLIDDLILFL